MKLPVIITILIGLSQLAFSTTIISRIEQDYQRAKIDYETFLVNSILAVFAPEELPQPYQTAEVKPLKCGTPLLMEIKHHWHSLSTHSKSKIEPFLNRPDLSEEYISESGRFKIHFDRSGYHAVDASDANQNALPDFVEAAGQALDYSYRLMIDTLQYNPPPDDRGVDGSEYDIYFLNIGMYGMTQPETEISKGPSIYTGYMSINNKFGPGFVTHGLDAVRVTCAHELFHMIQLGYAFRFNDRFYMEICSTWMEDFAYDEVNDYYAYLSEFFRNTDVPFNTYDGAHEYGACLWNHLLEKKFGVDLIRSTWEFIAKYPALEAMDYALIQQSSSFRKELEAFSIWNFYTGLRSEPIQYYPEGEFYPEVTFRKTYSFQTDVALNDSLHAFSNAYYYFTDRDNQRDFALVMQHIKPSDDADNDVLKYDLNVLSYPLTKQHKPIDKNLYIQLNAEDLENWRANAIILYDNGQHKITPFSSISTPEIPPIRLFPNPFIIGEDKEFKIEFKLDRREWVEIKILSMNGQLIKNIIINGLIPGFMDAGFHPEGEWDGTNDDGQFVSSGIYLVCLKTDSFIEYRKVSVIRK